MNEMYEITVLMLYTLFILIVTLLNTYHLFINRKTTEDKFIYPIKVFIQKYLAPLVLNINSKKDYRLNMKRRPPIILGAH